MKVFHGVISVLLGVVALYLMFIKAETSIDFVGGFVVLMGAIVFMCFMIMEEQKQEIKEQRREIKRLMDIITKTEEYRSRYTTNKHDSIFGDDGVEYWAYK